MTLFDIDYDRILGLIVLMVVFFTAVEGRQSKRFSWLGGYLIICILFCGLLFLLARRFPLLTSSRGFEIAAIGLYSLLECRLVFLLVHNEPIPSTIGKATEIAGRVLFYFWLLILLGKPQFMVVDTATLIAAESLVVTVLMLYRLETVMKRRSFAEFMRSERFTNLLYALGCFSFAVPVCYVIGALNLRDQQDILVSQTDELLTFSSFFLLIRKDLDALPSR